MRVSSRTEALTAGQRSELNSFRARWSAMRRSTEAADRDAAEEGVRLAYVAASLTPPERVVWCESPVAMSQAAHIPSRADGPNSRWELIDRLRREVFSRIRKAVSRKMLAEVESAVNPADALVAACADVVARAATQDNASLFARYRRSEPLSWSCVRQELLGRQGFRYLAAGPGDLSWLATCDVLRRALGVRAETESLAGLSLLAANVGWLQPHARTCWLSERPEVLRGDVGDRLHGADGPALRFRDGWSVWAWRGVEVPRQMIEHPEALTLAAIDEEANVQIRRCMIEIMTPQRYVASGGAVRIAEDETGVLWRKNFLHADAWAAVEVINATPEADGTRRHFFLQVPPNLQTAREAVAWTYGMRPEVYAQLVVRT
jgi:hypothetical protein